MPRQAHRSASQIRRLLRWPARLRSFALLPRGVCGREPHNFPSVGKCNIRELKRFLLGVGGGGGDGDRVLYASQNLSMMSVLIERERVLSFRKVMPLCVLLYRGCFVGLKDVSIGGISLLLEVAACVGKLAAQVTYRHPTVLAKQIHRSL